MSPYFLHINTSNLTDRGIFLEQSTQNLGKVIKINESAIKDHLGEMVRGTIERNLNQTLDEEATRMSNAEKIRTAKTTSWHCK